MVAIRPATVRPPSFPLPTRWLVVAAALLASMGGAPRPAAALEQIDLNIPVLDTMFTVNLSELNAPGGLFAGTSDLAELDRATNGAIGRRLLEFFNYPLPIQSLAVVRETADSPLASQALLLVSAIGGIDGLPADINGEELRRVLDRAATRGPLTMLTVLQALPGQTASVDLELALFAVQRLSRQLQPADRLIAAGAAARQAPSLVRPGPLAVERRETSLVVSHRPDPLQVVVVSPGRAGNGRLVLISHGLWDDPESFEGWASHLASHGYTVLLPRHPGSDLSQQRAMLSGTAPPPSPAELRLRPLDVSSLIDGAAAGKLGLAAGLRTDFVAVLGQSWGATTVLQLAGAQPSATLLEERCGDVKDPARNLSWVLQCSFISSASEASLADPRVKAVVAVSPPMSLLFNYGAALGMNARALVVSGSRDWVVPSGPEAITPLAAEAGAAGGGHRLVIAEGGDHFNLGSRYGEEGGGALGGLLLAWVDGAFAAGAAAAPGPAAPSLLPANGWGNTSRPLFDVTERLQASP
ncbi:MULTISPECIES: dienelactone hydrolase [Synechococcaceae]|uniref:alpha/beta hydrolase family protein n=1 Tax=Synechococcaceae TaxID=1890426 RepID=UPI00090B06FD|nr:MULTISPECIES: dienelactone hydrolase [Synechococcaceae]APD47985.1 dienelactone hydrolase [Synechococcus sp. SynAce01]TWB91394.1 putative dienelactone hydrolase [Synechococcus sp. Ace-Pa]